MTHIAKNLGCNRTYVYHLMKKYATFAQAVEEEREALKDVVEIKLIEEIEAGNMTGIIFYLKTQGRDRGYIERHEVTGRDGGAIEVNHSFDEALKKAYGRSE